LVKSIIAPFLFCMIVTSIVEMEDLKGIGKLGIKIIIYFEIITTLALLIGFVVAKIIQPGVGMNVDLSTIDPAAMQIYAKQSSGGAVEFFMNIIPSTLVGAFTGDNITPILFIALLFGFALQKVKSEAGLVIDFIAQLLQILFKIINFIMKLAPLAAFGAMSYTIGEYGIASLVPLGSLILTFYITCFLFIFLVLGAIAKYSGFGIWPFLKYIKEEIFLVFSASSLEVALPSTIKKLEDLGCSKLIARTTISTGYNFNLDGTCIYFTMAIIFITQAANINLTWAQELSIIAVLLITSKGATGAVGSGFVALAATLSVIDYVPLAGLTLILGIDRFMSEGRAVTNIISNAVAAMAISKWEGKSDKNKIQKLLYSRK
jgi:aerobic C4-dicarboxylate transport protein